MSYTNTSMEDIHNSKNLKKDNNMGILQLMECFDKQSRVDDTEKTNNNFNQSFESNSISQNQFFEKKQMLNNIKIQQDTNLALLRHEFEDDLKKKSDNIAIKSSSQAKDFKKLLDDIKVIKKDKEKKLIIEYSTLMKLTENDTSISTDASFMKSKLNQSSFSKNSFQSNSGFVNKFDKSKFLNSSSQMSQANSFTNTEENILNLQSQIVMIQQKQEAITNKQLLEQNKQNALHNMRKELDKSKNMLKQEINNYQGILDSYKIQAKQAGEKQLKFDQEYARKQVDLLKVQQTLHMGEQINNNELINKENEIEITKEELNQAVLEYRELQSQIEKCSEEHDQTLIKIEEENQKLKQKYLLMIESRQLMKEIDDFDVLTKNFIYETPSEEQVQQIQNKLKQQQEYQKQRVLQHQQAEQMALAQGKFILSLEEQDLMDLMDRKQKGNNSGKTDQIPQYKQGTILQKFKKFIKDHNGDLNEVINLILQKHEEYDMEFQTLGRRIEDLQEEKRVLDIEHRNLQEQTKDLVKIDYNEDGEIISSQKTNNNQDSQNNRQSITNYQEQEQQNRKQELKLINSQLFEYQQYLFLNEIIFRFAVMGGLIKSISNSCQEVKNDQYIQANLFDNEFYENLEQMLKFAISNKGQNLNKNKMNQTQGNLSNFNNTSNNNILNSTYKQDSIASRNNSMLMTQKSQFQSNSNFNADKIIKKIESVSEFNTHKLEEFKKIIETAFEKLGNNKKRIQQIIQKDFIIQYFCSGEDLQNSCDRINKTIELMNVQDLEEQIQIINQDFLTNLKSDGIQKFNTVLKNGLEHIQSYLSNLQFNKNNLFKILYKRAPESPVFKASHIRQRLEAQQNKNNIQLSKKKNWKDKVIKNKIEQYQQFTDYKEFEIEKKKQEIQDQMNQTNYTTQTQTQEQFYMSELRSSTNFNKQHDTSQAQLNAQEEKYLDGVRDKEKNYLIQQKEKQEQMIREMEQKEYIDQQSKPKVISRYQQNSKYDLKYQEQWSFLVNQKKEFHKITAEQEKQKLLQEKKKLKEITKFGATQSHNVIKTDLLYTQYKNKLQFQNYSDQKSNPNYINTESKTLLNRHISSGKMRQQRSFTNNQLNKSVNQNAFDKSGSRQDSIQSNYSKKLMQNSSTIKKGARSISTAIDSNNKNKQFKLQPIYTNNNNKLSNTERIQMNNSANKSNSQYNIKNYGQIGSDSKYNL